MSQARLFLMVRGILRRRAGTPEGAIATRVTGVFRSNRQGT
jgi:hypothetical protein